MALVFERMGQEVDKDKAFVMYQEILGRVINAMCNSFFMRKTYFLE